MAQPSPLDAAGSLAGAAKLQAVTDLMTKLTGDIQSKNLSAAQRDSMLEQLKVLGRDPRNADPIFTNEGIETLTKHAFDSESDTTARNALRVLCNSLVLKPATRQLFVNQGYEAAACARLKNDSWDDEFLVSRVLFLSTYGTNIDLVALIDKHDLANTIAKNLSRHAALLSVTTASQTTADPMEQMALKETLILLFNVASFCGSRVSSLTAAIPHIVTLLVKIPIPPERTPLAPPVGSLVNALMNLEFDSKEARVSLYPEEKPTLLTDKLIELLDSSMKAYRNDELEETVTPLLGVIEKVYVNGPEACQKDVRKKLLPTEEDRRNVLGRGESLSARLLRSSMDPTTPKLGTILSNLLFELSESDASKFVQNVGYGFASGFLFQRGIPVPGGVAEGQGSTSADSGRRAVNPITGQYLDSEHVSQLPEMTNEEKEREAERLFVLFERLRANGVINVQNPVQQAVQEGRFEELPDDDED